MPIINPQILFFLLLLAASYVIFYLSARLRMPAPLLLFAIGLACRPWLAGVDMRPFIFASLVIMLFDAGADFIPRRFDSHAMSMLKFIAVSLMVNAAIVMLILHSVFYMRVSIGSVLFSALLGFLLTASTQHALINFPEGNGRRSKYLLEVEDDLSNPIVMGLAIILLNLLFMLGSRWHTDAIASIISMSLVDIGVGVMFGLFMLYVIVQVFNRRIILLPALICSFASYFLAAYLKGSGFLSVIVMSLFFHNIIARRPQSEPYSSIPSNIAYMLIFFIMGVATELTPTSVLIAVLLFSACLLMRYLLIGAFIKNPDLRLRLDCEKGLAIGAFAAYIVLSKSRTMSLPPVAGLDILLQAVILVCIMSIIVSYFVKISQTPFASGRDAIGCTGGRRHG